jgi:hypothetical protein
MTHFKLFSQSKNLRPELMSVWFSLLAQCVPLCVDYGWSDSSGRNGRTKSWPDRSSATTTAVKKKSARIPSLPCGSFD